jgi:hypothetical protein
MYEIGINVDVCPHLLLACMHAAFEEVCDSLTVASQNDFLLVIEELEEKLGVDLKDLDSCL